MRVPVIAVTVAILVLGTAVAHAAPRVETFPVPQGHLPTEIARHGDVMTFVSWKDWPSIDPHLGRVTTKGRMQLQALEKDHMPGLMSQAPDGSLWLSDGRKTVLWRVSPDGKAERVTVGRTSLGIAVDADGSIWVTHPEKGDITRYGADGQPQSQWFIGRKRGPASGAPSMAIPKPRIGPMPTPPKKRSDRAWTKEERKKRTLDARPTWIVVGPDQGLWFTEPTWRKIGRVTAAGKTSSYDYPSDWGEPRHIIAGPDGALWFTLTRVMALGRITTEGEITTIDLPYGAGTLATDSKKRVWFTDASGAQIGYVDGRGKVHEVPLPKAPRLIRSMAEGPDGAMWFADQAARVIGRITL
ncbi:MAG: Vgb family protein [Thermoanaerobaculia bacterium]